MFVRVEAGSTDIARARLADGAIRAVTRTPGREETWPYWSDTARRLVFQIGTRRDARASERGPTFSHSDLVLWNPETGAETPLQRSSVRDERWPAWSPDGRFVVYAFRGGRPAAGIARFELASGAVEILASAGPRAIFRRPSFAASGQQLAVEQQREDGTGSGLRVLAISPGAPLRRVTDDAGSIDTKGYFTRDGAELLFTRQLRRSQGRGPTRRVYRVAAAGGDARPVFPTAAGGSSSPRLDEHSARPSPSRDEFAFVSNRHSPDGPGDGNDSELYVAALDGGAVQRLTHTPEWSEYAPRWSPDGERIAVIAAPAERGPPRLVDVSELAGIRLRVYSRAGERLFDTPGMMADWMPAWP